MIKVLIVDDNQSITDFVKMSLEELGQYQVMTAPNGNEGVSKVSYFDPDIIFLDVMLPDMDGPEAATLIRKLPGYLRVPIIFLTGIITPSEVEQTQGVIRGETYLAKPVSRPQLVECINQTLGQKPSQ